MSKKFISGVYFILNEETNLIKIGCSKDINRRYKDLQAQNEHLGYTSKLALLDKIIVENYYDLEQYIHNKFTEKRVINEWFRITKEDIKEIKVELEDNSYRGFDSGYIKIDRNATVDFLNMGLKYMDIGLLLHIKDFIDVDNVLSFEGKKLNQNTIIELLNVDRKYMYNKFILFEENGIIKSIKDPKDNRSKFYVMNPKYFRLSNYNVYSKYKDVFN